MSCILVNAILAAHLDTFIANLNQLFETHLNTRTYIHTSNLDFFLFNILVWCCSRFSRFEILIVEREMHTIKKCNAVQSRINDKSQEMT